MRRILTSLATVSLLGAITIAAEPPASQPAAGSTVMKPLPSTLQLDVGDGAKIELVLIPAGEFLMGSRDSEQAAQPDEFPRHEVRISRPFYMGKCEVTQAQWETIMGGNPSRFKGKDLPVENVTWNDCREFCTSLSKKTGKRVRLPSEAEWEYACRAESQGRYCWGDAKEGPRDYGWYSITSENRTHAVGTKKPNKWGLYDMHGNVAEWCQDWYGRYPHTLQTDPKGPETGSERVARGGGWSTIPVGCRSAVRDKGRPEHALGSTGLRIVVEP